MQKMANISQVYFNQIEHSEYGVRGHIDYISIKKRGVKYYAQRFYYMQYKVQIEHH